MTTNKFDLDSTRSLKLGTFDRLISAVASLFPNSASGRPKRRPKTRGSPESLPNWLRQDLGLPPYEPDRRWFDHE